MVQGKALLVFGGNVALEPAFMQIEGNIAQGKSVFGKTFDRIFKKVHIIGFLPYVPALFEQFFVNFKKTRIGQPAVFV